MPTHSRDLTARPPGRALAKTFRTSSIAALAATMMATAPALADDDAPLKKGGFQLSVGAVQTISVNVSQDRTEGAILSSPLALQLHGKIDFKRGNGFVERAGLFAGHCKRTDCGPTHRLLWYRSQITALSSDGGGLPENDWNINLQVSTTPDRLLSPMEQIELIQRCKQNPHDEFVHWTTVTLSANTRTEDFSLMEEFSTNDEEFASLDETDFNGGDQSRHADFAVLVSCVLLAHGSSQPEPKTPENQTVGFDHGAMKVDDIRLTLTTYANAFTQPTPGTQCKKAKLAVTLETNQAGPVSFRLWGQRGDGAIASETVDATALHDDGRFFAVHERWVTVDETTNVQFKARDMVNEVFYQETPWKDITLHCTGAGGGGLALDQGSADDDIPVPQPKPQVNPAVGGGVGGLTAGVRPTHSGGAAIVPILPVSCRGGTVSGGVCACGPNKLRKTIGARDFQCVAVAKPPEVKPPLRVTPVPKAAQLVCKGGSVARGKCVCGAKATAVKIGAASFACRKTASLRTGPTPKKAVQEPGRVTPQARRITPKAQNLVCNGGTVRAGACGCPKGEFAKKTGPARFRCVARRG